MSLHEGVDTSTPNARLVFGIFASIAEFERELIPDRVRSGLAAAKAKGKRLGRSKVSVDLAEVARLREAGDSWSTFGEKLGLGEGTVRRAAFASAKKPTLKTPRNRLRCLAVFSQFLHAKHQARRGDCNENKRVYGGQACKPDSVRRAGNCTHVPQ